jgi:hypothetical protein
VLTLADDRITAITRFIDNSPRFGLPRILPDTYSANADGGRSAIAGTGRG